MTMGAINDDAIIEDVRACLGVRRTILILEAIGDRAAGMTNSEISRRLNIPKSTASFILRTLEQNRYISRLRSIGRYRLGLKLLALGRGVQIHREIILIAQRR